MSYPYHEETYLHTMEGRKPPGGPVTGAAFSFSLHSMKITHKWLVAQRACSEQLDLFDDTFGTEVEVTRAVLAKHGAAFDLNWLANHLLTPEQLAAYAAQVDPLTAAYAAQVDPLTAAYEAQVAPLTAAYDAQVVPLWAAYCTQVAPLRAAYNAQVASLWDAYDAQVDPLWAAYRTQVAPLTAAYKAQVATLRAAYYAQVALVMADVLSLP